jgi:hypothetical protein
METREIECPKCGCRRARSRAPGPGEGGVYRIWCPECGHEEAGICDRAPPWAPELPEESELPEVPEDEPWGRCSVCGKPGRVQNLPGGVPVSDCFCDEHAPTFVVKPLPLLLALLALALVVWLLYSWVAG